MINKNFALILIIILLTGCVGNNQATSAAQPPAGPVNLTIFNVIVQQADETATDVQVMVTGSLPDGCSQTTAPSIEREGRLYSIDLQGVRVVDRECTPGPVSFERSIPIAVGTDFRQPSGKFAVLVNGVPQYFEIRPASMDTILSGAGTPTVVAPVSITSTPEPSPTSTPTTMPTPTVTVPALPVNVMLQTAVGPANCTYTAGLYEDIALPNNNSFEAGAAFVKTWRIRNEGSCAWGEGVKLVLVKGDAMGANQTIAINPTASGGVAQVDIAMTAPMLPGMYFNEWAVMTPDGQVFGMGITGKYPIKLKVGVKQSPLDMNTCEYQFSAEEEQKILEYLNEERAKNGLPPHVVDEQLSEVARAHSIERGCLGVHSHFGADGKNYESRVKKAGIVYKWINEIIYNGAAGAKWAVNWWVYKSKLHHDIVMSSKYSVVGIGYVRTNKGEYPDYFTVLFMAPP